MTALLCCFIASRLHFCIINNKGPAIRFIVWRGVGSFSRYAFIGIFGAAIDLALFALMLSATFDPVLSALLSAIAGSSVNYVLNSRYNFLQKISGKGLVKYLTVTISGLGISTLIYWQLSGIGISPIVAKCASISVIILVQYVVNRTWTFKILSIGKP